MGEGNSKVEVQDNGSSSSSAENPIPRTKLMEAAIRGQTDVVAKLLKKGKKVDKKDAKGETALHKAATMGHTEVLELLLKKGADVHDRSSEVFTAFHYAVLHGRKECAKMLLECGADVNAKFTSNPGVSLGYSFNTTSGVFVWRIENFSNIKDRRVYSETFSVYGHRWKLVAYPHGSKGDDNLSVYLEVADHDALPDGWSHLANFSFAVINQNDGSKKIVREVVAHRFYKNHTDLGFPQLVKKTVLKDKKSGFLLNDTLIIEFQIEILESTTYGLDEVSGTYTWKMTDVGLMKERVTSGAFKIGSCKWMIAVYPRGKGGGSNLSMYLKVADSSVLAPSWFYLVNFRFSVINQNDGRKFSRQVESKNFRQKVEDWGFPQFMKLGMLYNPSNGYIAHNSVLIEVQVEIINEPKRKKGKTKHNNPSKCEFTPLHWAAYKGAADGVKLLLERGADVNAVDASGRTPLDWAAYQGADSIVELLIVAGADVNCRDVEGFSPLHKSVLNCHLEVVKSLLTAGTEVNAKSNNGTTPLQLAIYINNMDCVELLCVNNGADVNCKDKQGRTPLHWAAFNGDIALMTLLLKLGADINCQDVDGYSPLHKTVWKGRPDCVKFILEHGADISCKCSKGLTPLHVALNVNEVECATMLLDQGADVNSSDTEGLTPLHKVVANGNLGLVELLLKWGANVNAVSHTGVTPLHLAISNSDIPASIFLLQRGAEVRGDTNSLLHFVARNAPQLSPEDLDIPPSTLSSDLSTLVNHPQYRDVTFLVEGRRVHAWRGILCARSDYFRAMFEQEAWKESIEAEVEVSQMSYHTFLSIIVYIYTGNIEPTISVDDALLLLSAANGYILPRLKMLCEKVIVKELNVDNVCHIFRAADLYQATFLHKACVQFFAEHIDDITDGEDVLKSESFIACIISFLNSQ